MAAPVVTRPPAEIVEEPKGGIDLEVAASYAKWVVIATVVLALVALVVVGVSTYSERSRVSALRSNWDAVYTATKGKERPEDVQYALEGVAEKVKGTPVHAYVLMRLGDMHFERATSARITAEERTKALERATELFKIVADSEPYKSNPVFGPLAIQNLALSLEQKQDYEGAIKILEDRTSKLEGTVMYQKLNAQMGRLYWLQFQKTNDAKYREAAIEKLDGVLRATTAEEDRGPWREQVEFLRTLVEKRGKALPEGTTVPVKPAAAPVVPAAPAVPVTPPAKNDAKKEEPKKDEPKKEEKKEEAKKTGALQQDRAPVASEAAPAGRSSGHISFAQLTRMAKEGRLNFCECVRCKDGQPEELLIPAAMRLE